METLSQIDLHIVSFDVPLPANYGGVIDVFNRLKALHEQGIKIALHCFNYGRGEAAELNHYCSELHYYSRKRNLSQLFSSLPFIVCSRANLSLLKNLQKDQAPILFEGHHSSFFLNHPNLEGRKMWVRTHNIEQDYYLALAKASSNLFKRWYYEREAKKLMTYEKSLNTADGILSISNGDQKHFSKVNSNTILMHPFHSYQLGKVKAVIEDFALYHGNLAVEENEQAALFLIKALKNSSIRLVIAGRNPCKKIKKEVSNSSGISLVESPDEEELNRLMKTAKVNCFFTQQSTGIKLKLIHALIEGNEVLVNSKMVEGTDLAQYCNVIKEGEDWGSRLSQMFSVALDDSKIVERQNSVAQLFNNETSTKQLIELLKK